MVELLLSPLIGDRFLEGLREVETLSKDLVEGAGRALRLLLLSEGPCYEKRGRLDVDLWIAIEADACLFGCLIGRGWEIEFADNGGVVAVCHDLEGMRMGNYATDRPQPWLPTTMS